MLVGLTALSVLIMTIFSTLVGYIAAIGYIDKHCLAGVFLHERYMLVGCSMEDNLWMVGAEHEVEAGSVTYITDDGHKV